MGDCLLPGGARDGHSACSGLSGAAELAPLQDRHLLLGGPSQRTEALGQQHPHLTQGPAQKGRTKGAVCNALSGMEIEVNGDPCSFPAIATPYVPPRPPPAARAAGPAGQSSSASLRPHLAGSA